MKKEFVCVEEIKDRLSDLAYFLRISKSKREPLPQNIKEEYDDLCKELKIAGSHLDLDMSYEKGLLTQDFIGII